MLSDICIPEDSIINMWTTTFQNTELWMSWRIVTGLGVLGATLERNVFFDYGEARPIFPNCSVMLIGPSGMAKTP